MDHTQYRTKTPKLRSLCEKCTTFSQAAFFQAEWSEQAKSSLLSWPILHANINDEIYLPILKPGLVDPVKHERLPKTSHLSHNIPKALGLRSDVEASSQVLLHESLYDFRQRIKSDTCNLCCIISRNVSDKDGRVLDGGYDSGSKQEGIVVLTLVLQQDKKPAAQIRIYYLRNADLEPDSDFSHPPVSVVNLNLYQVDPRLAVQERHARGTRLRPDSLVRLQQMLTECKERHICGNARPMPSVSRPARFIRIAASNGSFQLQLVETGLDRSSISYAALSHCWGPSGLDVKLLQCNYTNWLTEIPFTTLPRTFRDAVAVTASLGLCYLWIDAICIIQDSESDWDKESATMCSVYLESAVTIAATASKDGQGGLFVQDDTPSSCTVSMPFFEQVFRIRTVEDTQQASWVEGVTLAPLNSRAWVFQESLLASRTIHFARGDVWWSCSVDVSREDPSNDDLRDSDNDLIKNTFSHSDLSRGNWTALVEQYSMRALTFTKDKLIAIGGVAEAFGRHHGHKASDYLAGLWRQNLKEHLLWQVTYFSSDASQNQTLAAPSWSWASRNGYVKFHPFHLGFPGLWNANFGIYHAETQARDGIGTQFSARQDGHLVIESLVLDVLKIDSQEIILRGCQGAVFTIPFRHAPSGYNGGAATHAIPIYVQILKPLYGYKIMLLSRCPGQAGTYAREDLIEVALFHHEIEDVTSSTKTLPDWWECGGELDDGEYLKSLGGGRYRVKLI